MGFQAVCAIVQIEPAPRAMMHVDGAGTFFRVDPKRSTHSWRITMFKKIFVSLFASLFLLGTLAAMSGCNTVEGAGKDIEKGGKAVKDEAREHGAK
jgi:predicted small secreted protein